MISPRRRRAPKQKAKKAPEKHDLDPDNIEEFDEIDAYEQLVSVWCKTHSKYESHFLPLYLVNPGELDRRAEASAQHRRRMRIVAAVTEAVAEAVARRSGRTPPPRRGQPPTRTR